MSTKTPLETKDLIVGADLMLSAQEARKHSHLPCKITEVGNDEWLTIKYQDGFERPISIKEILTTHENLVDYNVRMGIKRPSVQDQIGEVTAGDMQMATGAFCKGGNCNE